MPERLTPPAGHRALSDPQSVLLELVEEPRERPGFSLAEAYAFLAGADANTSTLPPIVVATYNPRQRRPFLREVSGFRPQQMNRSPGGSGSRDPLINRSVAGWVGPGFRRSCGYL